MQLKMTESILGFKHNLDSDQVQSKLQEIIIELLEENTNLKETVKFLFMNLTKKSNIFGTPQDSKMINEIIQRISEYNESHDKKENDEECSKGRDSQKTRYEATKGLLLCGKKRKPGSRNCSTTEIFTPIDLKTLNNTEKSFYLMHKQQIRSSEVLSDQMEEIMKKNGTKLLKHSHLIAPENLYEADIDPNAKYCVCQSAWDGKADMLECEGDCKNWYHPKCLGISDKQFETILKSGPWICNICKDDSH